MKGKNFLQKLGSVPQIGPYINGFIGILLPLGLYYLWLQKHVDAGVLGAGLILLGWNAVIISLFRVIYKLAIALGIAGLVIGIHELLTKTFHLTTGATVILMIAAVAIGGFASFLVAARQEGDGFFDPAKDLLNLFRNPKPTISSRLLPSDVNLISTLIQRNTSKLILSIEDHTAGVAVRTGQVEGHFWMLNKHGDDWQIVEKTKHRRGRVIPVIQTASV